jgi:hypothetical protein
MHRELPTFPATEERSGGAARNASEPAPSRRAHNPPARASVYYGRRGMRSRGVHRARMSSHLMLLLTFMFSNFQQVVSQTCPYFQSCKCTDESCDLTYNDGTEEAYYTSLEACTCCTNTQRRFVTEFSGSGSYWRCVCTFGYTGLPNFCSPCGPSTYKDTLSCSIIQRDNGHADCAGNVCKTCPANSGHQLTARTSVSACICNAGYTGPNGGTCTACVAGKYKIVTGNAACTDCGAGTYSTTVGATASSTCVTCGANRQSSSGSAALTSCICNLGFTGPNGGTCTACVAGKYKIVTGAAACTDCGANTYSATVGATVASTCQACGANRQSSSGSGALTSCICNMGYTGPNGGTCTACAVGKYKIVTGAAACTDCGANTYSATVGATVASTCQACGANRQSSSGSGALTSCICNMGFTGPNGGTCTACAAGKYKTATGSAACTDCGAGKYLTTTGATALATCTACPSNSQSGLGSTALTSCVCNLGFTGPNGGTCVANCRELWGYFNSRCTVTCGSGQYLTYTQAFEGPDGNLDYLYRYGYCASCAAGTCPSNYDFTITGLKAFGCGLCPCDAGFTGPNGGPCAACAAGKYKTATGSAACTNCGANRYSTATGATAVGTCQSCPANAQAPVGSTALASCLCNLGFTGPMGGPCAACGAGTYGSAGGYFPAGIQQNYPISAISTLGTTTVRALVKECGADANTANENGVTPIYVAACQGHTETVRALVQACGADPKAADNDGSTPVYVAARYGHTETVRALVREFGADANTAANSGCTLVGAAAKYGHTETVRALVLEFGADATLPST